MRLESAAATGTAPRTDNGIAATPRLGPRGKSSDPARARTATRDASRRHRGAAAARPPKDHPARPPREDFAHELVLLAPLRELPVAFGARARGRARHGRHRRRVARVDARRRVHARAAELRAAAPVLRGARAAAAETLAAARPRVALRLGVAGAAAAHASTAAALRLRTRGGGAREASVPCSSPRGSGSRRARPSRARAGTWVRWLLSISCSTQDAP